MKESKLTYEMARRMSIWIWTLRARHDWIDYREVNRLFKRVWGIVPLSLCGFCEFFTEQNGNEISCSSCPLKWEHPKEEIRSNYSTYSRPCSRNYWHWSYWNKRSNPSRSRYWAHRVLKEIQATPRII